MFNELVTALGVGAQRFLRGGVKRYQTGLVELCLANHKQTFFQIDIFARQPLHFTQT